MHLKESVAFTNGSTFQLLLELVSISYPQMSIFYFQHNELKTIEIMQCIERSHLDPIL